MRKIKSDLIALGSVITQLAGKASQQASQSDSMSLIIKICKTLQMGLHNTCYNDMQLNRIVMQSFFLQ